MSIRLESVLLGTIEALQTHAIELDEAQSVRGIDALSETQLHHYIALGIKNADYGVLREQCYPSPEHDHCSRAKRQRCDLVVLPDDDHVLVDPVAQRREDELASETLFAGCDLATATDRPRCLPEQAVWIEVKSVAQFACRDGVYTPNRAYGTELTDGLASDIAKLASTTSQLILAVFVCVNLALVRVKLRERSGLGSRPSSDVFQVPLAIPVIGASLSLALLIFGG